MNNYDNVEPKEKWEFDESVADVFENMLARSIPQYSVMRDSVTNLVYDIITTVPKKKTFQLLDVGCSDGLMLESITNKFKEEKDYTGYYLGVDISESMLERAKKRFIDTSVSIRNCDLRTDFPIGHYDVVTSILTLQFIPINYRQEIIQNIYNNLSDVHGGFLMVEKVLGNTSQLDKWFIKNYYDCKEKNGYSKDQIERKRLSLEGVLVPVTNDWNIQLLKSAGFRQVDVFWRWMNFVGYIAIK